MRCQLTQEQIVKMFKALELVNELRSELKACPFEENLLTTAFYSIEDALNRNGIDYKEK